MLGFKGDLYRTHDIRTAEMSVFRMAPPARRRAARELVRRLHFLLPDRLIYRES
jgi:hypothetical protein